MPALRVQIAQVTALLNEAEALPREFLENVKAERDASVLDVLFDVLFDVLVEKVQKVQQKADDVIWPAGSDVPARLSGLQEELTVARQVMENLRAKEAWLRRQMKNDLNFPPNFEGLVLGCIDASKQARSSSPSRRKKKREETQVCACN